MTSQRHKPDTPVDREVYAGLRRIGVIRKSPTGSYMTITVAGNVLGPFAAYHEAKAALLYEASHG